jgi:DNA-binding transcriptional LysR family regulator
MPAVVDQLSRRYPKIVFHLSAGEAAMMYRTLEERRVDLVIAPIFISLAEDSLHAEILYDDCLVVVAGARSPWARSRRLHLVDLAARRGLCPHWQAKAQKKGYIRLEDVG